MAFFIVLVFLVPALLLRKTHVLHIHHYNVGMVFVVMIAYQNVLFAVFSGIANGWMIEGVTVYAYDPVFKPKTLPKTQLLKSELKRENEKESAKTDQGPPNA